MNRVSSNLTAANEKDSNSSAILITVSNGIIQLFGLCENILIILTIGSGPRRFQSNYYRLVFHLAACDVVLL